MDLTGPLNVHWEMTNVCNLRCVHCYQQDDGHRQPLPPSEKLFTIAHRIIDASVFELTITGGEPLLVSDLRRLITLFNVKGIRPHITSNGMLVDDATADWLSRADLTFQVSIDGADADVHNAIRGSKYAFDRAIEGIRRLVARQVNVSIAYCATPANAQDIRNVVGLAKELGVKRVCVGEVLPRFGSPETARSLSFASEQYALFVAETRAIARTYAGQVDVAIALMSGHRYDASLREAPCTALDRDLAILHDGWVYPCPFVRSPDYRLGNILDESIRDIWKGEVARRFREEKASGSPKHCTFAASPRTSVDLQLLPTRFSIQSK